MRFMCLGYLDTGRWDALAETEREGLIADCFAYDDELRRSGHFLRGEALLDPHSAVTVRWRGGRAAVTDGPYAETKEVLGGLLLLEADDLNQAIALMQRHPGVRMGGFEIRPLDEELTVRAGRHEPPPS